MKTEKEYICPLNFHQMNPSANGWISKLIHQNQTRFNTRSWNEKEFYEHINSTGFTYGTNVRCLYPVADNQLTYTQEELAKLNLIMGLLQVHYFNNKEQNAVEKIVEFYSDLTQTNTTVFSNLFSSKDKHTQLEKIIHLRVQPKGNLLQKNFSKLITNAMLFLDIICFRFWLKNPKEVHRVAKEIEGTLMNLIYLAIQEKTELGKYDELIMNLLESSLRYEKNNQNEMLSFEAIPFNLFSSFTLQRYAIDLICMTIYSDELIEANESEFVFRFSEKIKLESKEVEHAIFQLKDFVKQHKSKIVYFNYKNPIQNFYNRTQRNTQVLLRRNKKRLIQEIMESKELLYLLKESTIRNLTNEEKQKVKDQLFDIFKSIPSLAIFALPGGGILLPIVIRFIPQLLPSSFNENNKTS